MLKPDEYLKTVRRPYPPLLTSIIFEGTSTQESYISILNEPFHVHDLVVSDYVWYYSKEDIQEGAQKSFEQWQHSHKLNYIIKTFTEREHALIQAAQESDIATFHKAYISYMPALFLIFIVDNPLEAKMNELLGNLLSPSETEQLMSQLNIPLQSNFYKQEEYDLVMAESITEHVKEYEWLNARYGEETSYTVQEAQKKLETIHKDEFLTHWEQEKNITRKAISYAKELLGKEQEVFVDFMQFIVYYRTQRTDIMNKAGYLFIPQLKRIASEVGLTYKELLHVTYEELISNNLPSKEIIDQRMKDFAMVLEDNTIKCVIGDECEQIRQHLKSEADSVTEFKGTIAQKGIITGTARLVFSKDDYATVQNGDILVTSMTTPNMVPIMKKTVAFVTDEGGITCHAAIISREMKKPCIIGTKIATQVLKNGDTIEVDANNGVVRIIQ